MKAENLIELGFNKNEAIVYLALVKYGRSDANLLIKETKFHKKIVYDNLDKLVDKGLINFILEKGKRVYSLASPNMLVEFFKDKKKEIMKKEALASEIAKQISSLTKNIKIEQNASVSVGISGIRSHYKTVVEEGIDYVVLGAPKEAVEIMGETFWLNFVAKSNQKKIKSKLLFNESLREYGKKIKAKNREIKFFSESFEPLTETTIRGDEVAIIVWVEDPILFLIKSKFVAESYRKFFENMWKEAKS